MSVTHFAPATPLFEEKTCQRIIDLLLNYVKNLTKKSPQRGRFRDFFKDDGGSFHGHEAAIINIDGMLAGRIIISAPKEMLIHFAGFVMGASNVDGAASTAILADIANTLTCNGRVITGADFHYSVPIVISDYNSDDEHKLQFPFQAASFHWFGHKGYIIFEREN